jgi:ornithine carbamoyltransferase
MNVRHFLRLSDLRRDELDYILHRTTILKEKHRQNVCYQPLQGKSLGMIFEKSSTRTRVSFEAGMAQLGGHAIFLSSRDTQLGRGEPLEDVARVLSRMVDLIMIRTDAHEKLERFARFSLVPVINGLSDIAHPCQLLADLYTFMEYRGNVTGKKVAWIGDSNNMCRSWMEAAALFKFQLAIACPEGYAPNHEQLAAFAPYVRLYSDPLAAVEGAHLVVTDVWASMGFENEEEERKKVFASFQVNIATMKSAAKDAIFMHCLPAHRGEEVAADVIDGPQSVVWDEAENRLHTQKALMEYLLLGKVDDK